MGMVNHVNRGTNENTDRLKVRQRFKTTKTIFLIISLECICPTNLFHQFASVWDNNYCPRVEISQQSTFLDFLPVHFWLDENHMESLKDSYRARNRTYDLVTGSPVFYCNTANDGRNTYNTVIDMECYIADRS